VAGGFFSHLPRARIRVGPFCLAATLPDPPTSPLLLPPHYPVAKIASVLADLKVLYTEHPSSSLILTATRGGGVAVSGHTYTHSLPPSRLVIDVIDGASPDAQPSAPVAAAALPPMSLAAGAADLDQSQTDALGSSLFLAEQDPAEEDEELAGEAVSPSRSLNGQLYYDADNVTPAASTLLGQLLQQQQHLLDHPHATYSADLPSRGAAATSAAASGAGQAHSVLGQPMLSGPYLRVRDWKSTVEGHVEAVVLFPGFNASVKHSIQRLGQFMAMGRFPPHIKPFVFSYPCAREATYLWAVDAARSPQTRAALHAFLRGLIEAGISDVHFLVHSLGAQAVIAALKDEEDGSRSPVSSLFALASASSATHASSNEAARSTSSHAAPVSFKTARLRTVTFLNPDCSLASFVHNDFACVRRVCGTITVVGDRKDGALDWSELGNGFIQTLKAVRDVFRAAVAAPPSTAAQPHSCDGDVCRPCASCFRLCVDGSCRPFKHAEDRPFSRLLTVGRNIFSLYAMAALSPASDADPEAQLHRRRARRKWLDLDAIDTSSMDANVHKIRHSYFDLNKLLIDDLNELIVTGKRAADRALLLHREGNIFSFCQAPSCVVNQ
jgi:hypothetical protein